MAPTDTSIVPSNIPRPNETYADFVRRVFPSSADRLVIYSSDKRRASRPVDINEWHENVPYISVIDFQANAEPREHGISSLLSPSGEMEQSIDFGARLSALQGFVRATQASSRGLVIHWAERSQTKSRELLAATFAVLAEALFVDPAVMSVPDFWVREEQLDRASPSESVNENYYLGEHLEEISQLFAAGRSRRVSAPQERLPILDLMFVRTTLFDFSGNSMLQDGNLPICELYPFPLRLCSV